MERLSERAKQAKIQKRRGSLDGFNVWLQASAEAKEAARLFLECDIELNESLLELGLGNEASDGRRMPGNTFAAEIERDMIRNLTRVVKAAKWDYLIATRQTEGEKISRRLAKAWVNILDS